MYRGRPGSRALRPSTAPLCRGHRVALRMRYFLCATKDLPHPELAPEGRMSKDARSLCTDAFARPRRLRSHALRSEPMGLLVDGQWRDEWYDTKKTGGSFERSESTFRHSITADGSSGFPAASGRYHLYLSLACPWCHRTLLFRTLKRLENVISVSFVEPLMLENGWTLDRKSTRLNSSHPSISYAVFC